MSFAHTWLTLLQIYDGFDADKQLFISCDEESRAVAPVISTGSIVTIRLNVENHWRGSKFDLKWESIDKVSTNLIPGTGKSTTPRKVPSWKSGPVIRLGFKSGKMDFKSGADHFLIQKLYY